MRMKHYCCDSGRMRQLKGGLKVIVSDKAAVNNTCISSYAVADGDLLFELSITVMILEE